MSDFIIIFAAILQGDVSVFRRDSGLQGGAEHAEVFQGGCPRV